MSRFTMPATIQAAVPVAPRPLLAAVRTQFGVVRRLGEASGFHWPLGRRPDDRQSLSTLGL
jgi:hypothetical protein